MQTPFTFTFMPRDPNDLNPPELSITFTQPSPSVIRFDRRRYQREYMRKYREKKQHGHQRDTSSA